MPRGSWKKRWIKLYVTGWLHGSIRWQFTSEERGVWADLLAWAGEVQKEGLICDNDGRPLPRDFMANALNIKQILLDRVIAKSIHEGRLEDKEGVLFVTNYEGYQSEYERQKPFRQKSLAEKAQAFSEYNRQYLKDFPDEVLCSATMEGYDYTDEDREADKAELFRNAHPEAVEEHEASLHDLSSQS